MPVGAVAYVKAATAEEALAVAQHHWQADKTALIISGSEDPSAAFDWQPSAEPADAIVL